jgi:hypothetical protein
LPSYGEQFEICALSITNHGSLEFDIARLALAVALHILLAFNLAEPSINQPKNSRNLSNMRTH